MLPETLEYWCWKCDKPVTPIEGRFPHPDGIFYTGLGCPYCRNLVYVKDKRQKELA